MKMVVLTALVLILIVPYAAPMQRPPQPPAPPAAPSPPDPPQDLGKWWKNSEIVQQLGLSQEQTEKIEYTFFNHRMQLIDFRAELQKEEMRLQPLMEADQPDEEKVSAQIDRVLAARGKLEKTNAMMMLAIRRILSVDQWKKLEKIRQERERPRVPRPPKPPSPPNPPEPASPPDPPVPPAR
jgi:Spy/CpxP family protein refolding chaperone